MGERYEKGGAWDPKHKNAMAQEVAETTANAQRRFTIADALCMSGQLLESLHGALNDLEKRTSDLRAEEEPIPSPKTRDEAVRPVSQVHRAIMDINDSVQDAIRRVSYIARTIDL